MSWLETAAMLHVMLPVVFFGLIFVALVLIWAIDKIREWLG